MQVSDAEPVTVAPPASLGSLALAVTFTAPAVAPRQIAVPRVESSALLMLTLTGSETDHVAKSKGRGGGGHPMGMFGPALNCCWFPGAEEIWLAAAFCGMTLSALTVQSSVPLAAPAVPLPPHPVTAKESSKARKMIAAGDFITGTA